MKEKLHKVEWSGLNGEVNPPLKAIFNDDAFHLFTASKGNSDKAWNAHRALVDAMTKDR